MVSRNPPRKGVQYPEKNPDKNESEKNDTEPAFRSSGAELGGDVTQVFQNATAEYTADLVQISSRLQDRLRAALEELTKSASPTASGRAADELNSAYRDILGALHNQDWEKMKSAQTAYLSRVQAQYGDAESAVRNQLKAYADAVQAAWQDARSELLAAFQKHIGAVKDSFANLSVDNADPVSLAVIAQNMAVVANYAHSAAQAAAAAGGQQPKA